MEKQTDFRIRSYGRTELAQLYNPCLTPKAAYRKLVGWIDHYPGLAVRLAELGKLPGSRSYTPAQVREIVEALGDQGRTCFATPFPSFAVASETRFAQTADAPDAHCGLCA